MNNFTNILIVVMYFLGLVTLYPYPRLALIFWSIPVGFAVGPAVAELYIKFKKNND